MVKMVSLKKTGAERKAEKDALGERAVTSMPDEDTGVTVHLDHHHLTKMGVNGDLKSGDDVQFHGKGSVERSESRSTPEGDRHSATLRLHKGGIEHDGKQERDGDEERKAIRGDLEKAYAGVGDKALPDKKGAGKAE